MEPFAGKNGSALYDEEMGLGNAVGACAGDDCYGEFATDVGVQVEGTMGSLGFSVGDDTADQNGAGEGEDVEDDVKVVGKDLVLGSLEVTEDADGNGDLFMNVVGNGNEAAVSGSLEVPMGPVVEEDWGSEIADPLGDEENTVMDQGNEVAYEQCVGENGEVDKIEVSGDSISLFVEFSCPGTESSGFHVSVKDEHEDMEMEEEIEECGSFDVGDVVWVKTKSQSWWPGKILDPSGAEVDTTEANSGHQLVAYLGSSHVSWCLPSQLKDFHENYSDMLKQNKSRNFTGAVDKAVHEFGKCVIDKLTSEGEKDLTSLLDEFGECCSTLLEPREFLSKLKFLAVNLMRPGVLDFSVMMNYLSAFYRSIGHENKPKHLLLSEADLENGTDKIPGKHSIGFRNRSGKKKFDSIEIGSDVAEAINVTKLPSSPVDGDGEGTIDGESDMGTESRSRKKSKYLSCPYINYGNREPAYEVDEMIVSDDAPVVGISVERFSGSRSIVKHTRKKFLGLQPKEFESPPDILSFESDGFLAEIRLLALDCVYSDKSDKVHMIRWFSKKLRSYLFHNQHNFETYVENASEQQEEDSAEASSPAASTELEDRSRRGKRIPDTEDGNAKMKPLSGLSDVSVRLDANEFQIEGLPDLNNGAVLGSPTSSHAKIRKKRKVGAGERTRDATESAFDHEDHTSDGNIKLKSGAVEAASGNGGRNKNKRTKTVKAVAQAAERGSSSLPDLNGYQGTNIPLTAEIKPRQQRRRKEAARSNNQDAPPRSGSITQPADAAPPLDYIKQNLQMLTDMLGNTGGKLSSELKARLEGDIKSLLDKVSGM